MKFGKKATYHLYHSCIRKTAYPTEGEAEGVLEAMRVAPTAPDWKPDRPLHVYPCDFADHWHIGHMSTRVFAQ